MLFSWVFRAFRLSFFEMILRISCLLVPKLQRSRLCCFFGSSFSNILHKKRAAQNLLTHDIECFGDGHRDLRFHCCSEEESFQNDQTSSHTEISWKVMSFLTLYFFWGGWILKCISARFRFDRSNCMSHFNCNQLYGLWNYPIHAWISSCSGNSFWSWGTRPAWRCPVPFLMPALPARRMQRVDSTPKVEVSTSCTPQLFLRPPPDLGWVLQDS